MTDVHVLVIADWVDIELIEDPSRPYTSDSILRIAPRLADLTKGDDRRLSLTIVRDDLKPDRLWKAVRAFYGPSGCPTHIAVHQRVANQVKAHEEYANASIAVFSHSAGRDKIYDALLETLKVCSTDNISAESQDFEQSVTELAALLQVNWDLEARLAILHACIDTTNGGSPDVDEIPVMAGNVIGTGARLREVTTVWSKTLSELNPLSNVISHYGSATVESLVNQLARERLTFRHEDPLTVMLVELREALLPTR